MTIEWQQQHWQSTIEYNNNGEWEQYNAKLSGESGNWESGEPGLSGTVGEADFEATG